MELNLKGKVALVIASSQGIGKACAVELFKEGAHVMLCGRNEETLRSVINEVDSLGTGEIAYHRCDITCIEDIKSLVQATHDKLGKIDILINNSGGPMAGNFSDFKDEDWQKAFELTLLGYIRIIREVLPDLKEKHGRIINLTSSSIKRPISGLTLSNVFRMGVLGLTKTLAEELAPYNILVHTIAPGRIATERAARIDEIKAKKQGVTRTDIEDQSKKQILLSRYGTPEEFAKVVTFFVSEACTYMTGSAILVDGGMVRAI